MVYLNDWFYRELSSASHLSWPGFAHRAAHLLNPDEGQRQNRLRKYKSDCVMTSLVLVLALLSEIECEFRYGRSERLRYVWKLLAGFSGEADEVYKLRYADRL